MTKSKAPAKSYEEITRQEIPSFEFFEQGPAPAKVSDLDLIRAVRAALAADPRLAGLSIGVAVDRARVTLTGAAIGPGTAAYAGDVARAVAGVAAVDNQIAITPGA
ncbi:MAG: BON domain-containing protein [Kofleriaceae bacterium]|nr:BON domain-containing protein [Myxococcales bacterium]MCB9560142.1 BON domain-containing protein [Kofleriaceae bacterium]MCB9571805.1 BON domain-containing protein [Kofleriaceae bacterium]